MKLQSVLLVFLVPAFSTAFSPAVPASPHLSPTSLQAGFFDAIFGPKSADASHILLKGSNANQQCEKLKMDIYKTAMNKGASGGGVDPEALMSAVSNAE